MPSPLAQRPLGKSGIRAPPAVVGTNVFGSTVDRDTSFRILDTFLAGGLNLFDTADVYAAFLPGRKGGESETTIGEWLRVRGNRNRVRIATKAGMKMPEQGEGLKRDYLFRAVDASLKRLGIEQIDLYQAHTDDANTPLEETLGAFAELIRQGKVRAIGASNYSAPRLAAALEVSRRLGLPRYESLQPLYNLMERKSYEGELQALCIREGLGVIPFFGLASGFLTGKYRSTADEGKSWRGRMVAKYLNERGNAVLGALDRAASRLNATPAQVATAWLGSRPGVTAPIIGASTVEQAEEIVKGAGLALDAVSSAELDAASQ
jgi:aryl-alcohol dehydrogenase-like predicted oxidoreductase